MTLDVLEEQIEFLLSVAIRKCGAPYEAEDLTQDTLLAALVHLSKGKPIHDLRGWLLTVLNNKWNDRLRKKYRQPLVTFGEVLFT
jgi:DNA-directed RNA polymerase specialized sigma24 family protein